MSISNNLISNTEIYFKLLNQDRAINLKEIAENLEIITKTFLPLDIINKLTQRDKNAHAYHHIHINQLSTALRPSRPDIEAIPAAAAAVLAAPAAPAAAVTTQSIPAFVAVAPAAARTVTLAPTPATATPIRETATAASNSRDFDPFFNP